MTNLTFEHMKKILSGVVFFTVMLALGIVVPTAPKADATDIIYFGGLPYTLAGAGITPSATSFTLSSFTIPQNGYPVQDSDLASTFYVTFEAGSKTRQEFASCTSVGANTGGIVTISGCTRGLLPFYPYTASTTLKFSHAGGTSVTFSDPPQLFNDIIQYANNLSFAGVPDASTITKGISELATQAESAASTATGSQGPLVIPNSTATSTFNAKTSANRVVVTGAAPGRIDPFFIYNATTTWPSNNGNASSTVLMNDGNGNDSWNILPVYTSFVTTVSSTTVQTSTTTMQSVTIPANTINGTNKVLRVTSFWSGDNSTACDFGLAFGTGSATSTVGFGTSIFQGVLANYMVATSSSAEGWTSASTAVGNPGHFASATNAVMNMGNAFTTVDLTAKTYLAFNAAVGGATFCKFNGATVEVVSQ